MQFKWAELQTSDAQLKHTAYGGFRVPDGSLTARVQEMPRGGTNVNGYA